MKKSLLCLALLLLSSCIVVDDFGIYWDKGYVDPTLIGQWQTITPREDTDRQEARSIKVVTPSYEVINNHGTYQINNLDENERRNKDYVPEIARTLMDP